MRWSKVTVSTSFTRAGLARHPARVAYRFTADGVFAVYLKVRANRWVLGGGYSLDEALTNLRTPEGAPLSDAFVCDVLNLASRSDRRFCAELATDPATSG